MEKIEYIGEVLPDGHVSLPKDIIKRLKLKVHTKLRVQIQQEKETKQGLSRFCGKWKDDNIDNIVTDIYNSRKKNIRSEKIKL